MDIPLPANTIETISGYVTDIIGDFSVVIVFILGVILAFFVIERIVDILRNDKGV